MSTAPGWPRGRQAFLAGLPRPAHSRRGRPDRHANPFAFARAVRSMFGGLIIVSGGLADGWSLWALRALGCDLGYMGTRFIATEESNAAPACKGHDRRERAR
jgi:hypothetical protein